MPCSKLFKSSKRLDIKTKLETLKAKQDSEDFEKIKSIKLIIKTVLDLETNLLAADFETDLLVDFDIEPLPSY